MQKRHHWKICCSKNSDHDLLSNDVVLLKIPVGDDVIYISSDDTLATEKFMHAHSDEDDDSWTLLNDE